MINILHIADLHIDSPLTSLNDARKASIRRGEIRNALGAIIEYAANNDIGIFLISGDLFDNSSTTTESMNMFIDSMAKHPEIHFFISPGNHDCVSNNSLYNVCDFPENVKIFRSNSIERVDLPEQNLCVYGCGFTSEYVDYPLIEGFRVEDAAKINIMVMHADTSSQNSRYNPVNTLMIEKTGLDYLALGHLHSFSGINFAGKTAYAYPGTPEPHGFDEQNEKGFIFGGIEKGKCELKFLPFSRRQFKETAVDITGLSYNSAVCDVVKKELTGLGPENIYRVYLSGEARPGLLLSTSFIEKELADDFFNVTVYDRTRPGIDFDIVASEPTIKGIFVRKLKERLSGATQQEAQIISLALEYGYNALCGQEVGGE